MRYWKPHEDAVLYELIQVKTASDTAKELTARFGHAFTTMSVIGRVNRLNPKPKTFFEPRTKGSKGHNKTKPRDRSKKGDLGSVYLAKKTPRWKAPVPSRALTIQAMPPRYQPKWTCQYIADSWDKCGKESHGPWCEEHKALVTKKG